LLHGEGTGSSGIGSGQVRGALRYAVAAVMLRVSSRLLQQMPRCALRIDISFAQMAETPPPVYWYFAPSHGKATLITMPFSASHKKVCRVGVGGGVGVLSQVRR